MIVHIIGLVLAFLTRKIKIESLNDSKYSTAIIYGSCFNLIIAAIVLFVVFGVNRFAIAWTTIIFIEVCTFLGLTFIQKVWFMLTTIANYLYNGKIRWDF